MYVSELVQNLTNAEPEMNLNNNNNDKNTWERNNNF